MNQAVKACAIAGKMAKDQGHTLVIAPGFKTVQMDARDGKGKVERSAITMTVSLLQGDHGA